MGDKYIIELEEKPFHKDNGDFLYRVKGFNSLVFDMNGIQRLISYTEPDLEQVREEAYEDGYKTAKVQCSIQAEKDLREVGERHYQKGYQDAIVKISSDEQAIAEKAYQKGLSDAWEAARKIYLPIEYGGIPADVLRQMFDNKSASGIFKKVSAFEAVEKLRQYEQKKEEKEEKEEIQVGDEVIYDGKRCVVVFPQTEHLCATVMDCGRFHHTEVVDYDELKKTGRHFPEISEVLRKMKENSNG